MYAAHQESIILWVVLGFHRHNIRRIPVVFEVQQKACSVEVGSSIPNRLGRECWRPFSLNLSEQQLIDCSLDYGTNGCNGGFYTNAWDYLITMGTSFKL